LRAFANASGLVYLDGCGDAIMRPDVLVSDAAGKTISTPLKVGADGPHLCPEVQPACVSANERCRGKCGLLQKSE